MMQQGTICCIPTLEYLHDRATITFTIHPHEHPQATWTLRYDHPDAKERVLQLQPGTLIHYSRHIPSPRQPPFPVAILEVAPHSALPQSA
ncbi:MAG: hypothetical protein OEY91_06015 [Nitrospirota bacterium]|nr:hypothetical protein [Nitrospirota bacterium]